ncbi:prolyl oligopeptidase [Syncephalis plumigaleata]|nr:prolyl oligopeptidase [Syncephalis plumigaleata]
MSCPCRITVYLWLLLLSSHINASTFLNELPKSYPKGRLLPPITKAKAFTRKYYGPYYNDPYNWVRSEGLKSKNVIRLIRNESIYAQRVLKESQPLRLRMFQQMVKASDNFIANIWYSGDYMYYSRQSADKQYPCYYRRSTREANASEVLILDFNKLKGKVGNVGDIKTSRKESWLAFTIDATGDEEYTLHLMDIDADKILPYTLENVDARFEWSATGNTILYTTFDSRTGAYCLLRHTVGNAQAEDKKLYCMKEESQTLYLKKLSNGQFFIITEVEVNSNEYYYMDATDDMADRLIPIKLPASMVLSEANQLASQRSSESPVTAKLVAVYRLASQYLFKLNLHIDDRMSAYFYICDIDELNNPHSCTRTLQSINADYNRKVLVFHGYVVVFDREKMTDTIKVYKLDANGRLWPNTQPSIIEFPVKGYSITGPSQIDFNSNKLVFEYSSLITPTITYVYDMATETLDKLHQNILPDYDESEYTTDIIYVNGAVNRHGKPIKIPITIAHRSNLERNQLNYAWLVGYGAYGIYIKTELSPSVASLLKHGFVYAIAHVRGGGELGMEWWHEGSRHNKENTFSDFKLAATGLVFDKYTRPELMVIEGTSAGGILMGTVINRWPDLAEVAILNAPFLSVLDVLMDLNSVPNDADHIELGDPQSSRYMLKYIRNYSPYDNIRLNAKHPNVLVFIGCNDPRVAYWDPIKWAVKLRANTIDSSDKPNPRTIVMDIKMNAGHFGSATLYQQFSESATKLAYAIDKLDKSRRALTISRTKK